MMKNSEWGAVAYLSQSVYGKYGNSMYTQKNKEIYKNDSTLYTGRSGGYPPYDDSSFTKDGRCYYDNIEDRGSGKGACGAGASTTGNIYGVFDMVGGHAENVMGYYIGGNISDVGFAKKPNYKYIDSYENLVITKACDNTGCYGHALSETEKWYEDSIDSLCVSAPWMTRGSVIGLPYEIGIFRMAYYGGSGGSGYSFRPVLVS